MDKQRGIRIVTDGDSVEITGDADLSDSYLAKRVALKVYEFLSNYKLGDTVQGTAEFGWNGKGNILEFYDLSVGVMVKERCGEIRRVNLDEIKPVESVLSASLFCSRGSGNFKANHVYIIEYGKFKNSELPGVFKSLTEVYAATDALFVQIEED